ncbi:integrase catalytic subunit [Caballeronia novacaledonica]|uniref:Integrase catalytic subunit n=1 Tax=Caballeronia novacaledonica TaxID=1544861 RepID=A0A2U3I409_9BURK|nr:integrase catalytic subunit [Caballeronia novacaledonica]
MAISSVERIRAKFWRRLTAGYRAASSNCANSAAFCVKVCNQADFINAAKAFSVESDSEYRDWFVQARNVSMSRRANAWDNAPMESFFKTLKVERIYQVHYETRAQARLDIVDWVEGYYNRERLHTSIDFCTPIDCEARLIAA